MKSAILFDTISKTSLYLLVILIPLWFLPVTQNILEYQKQALLVVLVFAGVASRLAKMVYEGKLVFRANWLHLPVAALLGVFGVSTLFSSWQYGSFWGWPLHVSDNFLAFLGFGLLYFLISQSVKDVRHLFFLLAGVVLSGALAVLFALLQMKGVVDFNTVGSANSVALFAAVLLPLALMLSSGKQKAWRGILLGVAILLFVFLALIDFSTAWVVVIAGLLVLLAFDSWPAAGKSKIGRISLPMVFVLVALFFLIVGDFSIPGAPVLQAEISPDFWGEFAILKGMASENPLKALIGSGPGTFAFEYAKFRPQDLNQTMFWNTRFSSGASEFLDWLVTKGTAGLFGLLVIIGAAGALAVKKIMQKDDDEGLRPMTIGLTASLTAGTVSFALYPANVALWFVFWVLAGSLGFLTSRRARPISLASKPSFLALGSSLALLTVVVVSAGLLIVGGQKYYAEMEYTKGARAMREGNVEEALEKIAKAASLNPSSDLHWRALAQLYLTRANQAAADQTLSADERTRQAGVAVNNAVAAAKRAVEASPANVANWNVRGFLYRNLISVQGADTFARESYEKSHALEPSSPFPLTELARVKILQAQTSADRGMPAEESEAFLTDALENLNKAVELKPDYAPAHYLIAVVQDQQGNQAQAIQKLEETTRVAPNDVGLAFQLGVIYYRLEELARARDEFERAKMLNPGYSNARYMLGLVYDRLGRKQDAQAEFEVVSEINPQNQEVQDILENLRQGRAALTGIVPDQPPIEEVPAEITEEP